MLFASASRKNQCCVRKSYSLYSLNWLGLASAACGVIKKFAAIMHCWDNKQLLFFEKLCLLLQLIFNTFRSWYLGVSPWIWSFWRNSELISKKNFQKSSGSKNSLQNWSFLLLQSCVWCGKMHNFFFQRSRFAKYVLAYALSNGWAVEKSPTLRIFVVRKL